MLSTPFRAITHAIFHATPCRCYAAAVVAACGYGDAMRQRHGAAAMPLPAPVRGVTLMLMMFCAFADDMLMPAPLLMPFFLMPVFAFAIDCFFADISRYTPIALIAIFAMICCRFEPCHAIFFIFTIFHFFFSRHDVLFRYAFALLITSLHADA